MEAAATLGSRGAETPSVHSCPLGIAPRPWCRGLSSSLACPSGTLCWRGPSEGSWNTRLCPGQVPLCSSGSLLGSGCRGQLLHSAPLGPRAQPGLAGCPGPGPPEGGRAGGTAPCWGGHGFQQQPWCPRHRFPRHAGAGLWLSGTHRCPEPPRRGRSVWDSEAGVHEDRGQARGCCAPGAQPLL